LSAIVENWRLIAQAMNALADHLGGAIGSQHTPVTFANLPSNPSAGMVACVSDSKSDLWGTVITGGGTNVVMAFYDGVYWSVMGATTTQWAVVSRAGPDPTGTNSTAELMMGLGATFNITPVRTGRVAAIVAGVCQNNASNGGLTMTGRYGAGATAPANGVAGAPYAVWSTQQHYYMQAASDVAGFTIIGGFVNESLGAPMWFDVSIAATGGGTASIADCQCLLWEL
jgi:hypothetical protein